MISNSTGNINWSSRHALHIKDAIISGGIFDNTVIYFLQKEIESGNFVEIHDIRKYGKVVTALGYLIKKKIKISANN